MTEMSVKEKAASEAAKQNKNQSVAILANKVADCEADPIDNAVTPIFTDEGNGVKSFKKENGDTFRFGELGVYFIPAGKDKDSARKVCGKLSIDYAYRDSDGGNWGRSISWADYDGVRHSLNVSQSDLAVNQQKVVAELASGGLDIFVDITRGNTNRVVDFIKNYPVRALTKKTSYGSCGWYKDGIGRAFVLPDRVIGELPNEEQLIFDGKEDNKPKYASRGTLEQWQRTIGEYALYSARIGFFMCIGFASPLMRLINQESGGFHLVGQSSQGKSTALRALCSLYAPAVRDGEMGTWRSTDNGLEGSAESHPDLPLIMDEMNQARANDLKAMIYMLANETGKNRMSRGLQVRKRSSWRLLFASSGEKTATEYMEAAGLKNEMGGELRLANIPLGNDKTLGIFDYLPPCMTSEDLALKFQQWSESDCYGTAGIAFIEQLIQDINEKGLEAFTAELKEGVETFSKSFGTESDSMVGRVRRRFALVAAAGEYAIRYGVLPWSEGQAVQFAKACYDAWRSGFKSKEQHEADFVSLVLSFHKIHGARFDELDLSEHSSVSADKRVSETRLDNRLGVRIILQDGEEVYYEPTPFVKEVLIKNGESRVNGLRILMDAGVLKSNDRCQMKLTPNSELCKRYGLKPARYYCVVVSYEK